MPLRKIGPAKMHGEKEHHGCSVPGCEDAHNGHGYCAKHRSIRKLYGLDPIEYERILAAQDNCCAICQKPCATRKKLSVDHDHATGEVRGLVCLLCNMGLGKFRDGAELLRRAVAYLESPRATRPEAA